MIEPKTTTMRRFSLRRIAIDDAFDQQDVAVGSQLRRAHDGERIARSLVERLALEAGQSIDKAMCGSSTAANSRTGSGTAAASPITFIVSAAGVTDVSTGNTVRIAVERFAGRERWQMDQATRDAGCRKIGVDDDELVAMAHRCQRMQQIGVEQRMDALEHLIKRL